MGQRRHPLAECESCPLNESGNAYVPSRVPSNPKVAIVGEAPGFQEAMRGIPFAGPSGKLLNTVLRTYKFKPSEVMYTNVCLCRPPGNTTPPKAAVASCRGRLIAELRDSGVDSVLALGGTAASTVLGDPRGVTTLRIGPPKPAPLAFEGSPVAQVVASWHPAYCLRTADAFPSLVTDIGKLQASTREPWTAPKYHVVDDPDTALALLGELEGNVEACVVDIEVGIDKDESFGHPNEYAMLCVGLAYRRGEAVVLGENAFVSQDVRDALGRFLRSTKIIAHNGKFDLAGLYPHLGSLELWFDTMLAHYALDERPGTHGLKVLAVEQLGAPQYDTEIKTYVPRGGNYADIPRPILYRYNAYDVSCTWDLYELFKDRLDNDGLRPVHDHMVRASNQLMYLEINGITIDRQYSDWLQGDYAARLQVLEAAIDRIVRPDVDGERPTGVAFNPRSPKQIKEYLHGQGITTPSTDEDHLTAIRKTVRPNSSVGKFVDAMLVHRRQAKLYGTYVTGIRKRLYRGRVYTTYMLHGTTSGRLASRNPNLQNVVRDKGIRKQWGVAHPDNIFMQADYKQAEGRIIATMAQDEYLRAIFSDPNIDMFNELSDQLYGPGNWTKEERVRTKAYFYGLSYGREAFSIAMEYGMTPAEAEKNLTNFMNLIPNVVQWQKDVRAKVLRGDDLITPFGRRRRFHLITDENKKDVLNEALSFLPQSTASDICLSALIDLRPMLKGKGWLRLTIHDALVVECPEKNKEEVAAMLKYTMEEHGRRYTDYVPFSVDLSYGKSWGEL